MCCLAVGLKRKITINSTTMNQLTNHPKLFQFVGLLVIFALLCLFINPSENNIFWRFPSLIAGLPYLINDSVEYLMFDWWPIQVYDPEIEEFEEKPLLQQVTRAISSSILFLIGLIREIILGGVKTIVTFTSWDFVSENKWARWPALPWTVVASGAILLGYKLQGKGLPLIHTSEPTRLGMNPYAVFRLQKKNTSALQGFSTRPHMPAPDFSHD